MKKVITYGSFDLFHFGHQRLLERAKALGDYLIVGVTSNDYDRVRGKINVTQPLAERIAAVKATGLADMILVEEYDGQKIDDIKRYNIDVFTVGSDWQGKFDYLNKYCKVVYLERTRGVSSSEIRSRKRLTNIGLIGNSYNFFNKIIKESKSVNGLNIIGTYSEKQNPPNIDLGIKTYNSYDSILKKVDAVYIKTDYSKRYDFIKKALENNKNVLCESPICLNKAQCKELFDLAKKNNLVLMEAIRTAYTTAYKRLSLLAEIGKIGDIVSIDATCTNMKRNDPEKYASLFEWGPNALLPIFRILGTNYKKKTIISHIEKHNFPIGDTFTKINFIYDKAVASILVAEGAKSEGELVISGTDGYIYVPAPWWKTEYFELRYENPANNRRYFYQLDGDGISYELVEFLQAIKDNKDVPRIDHYATLKTCEIMHDFITGKDLIVI
ncbi:adenylyltransferase/cytidyltransferase family protein [Candidatus Saccharibacteria bacterium]|nr:adenylyltransferase/cytidyltransferase family protein [Candidatus Saccharibacteria bacterium]